MWIALLVCLIAIGVLSAPVHYLRRALRFYQADRPNQAIRPAKTAISLGRTSRLRIAGYQILALVYASIGQYAEGLSASQRALDLARRIGDLALIARSICLVASNLRRQGRLMEAYNAYQDAANTNPVAPRDALIGIAECLIGWGRSSEAFPLLQQAQSARPQPAEALERRSQATIAIGMAIASAEVGGPDVGLQWADRAIALGFDVRKIVNWATLLRALSLAMLGRADEARSALRSVETGVDTNADVEGYRSILLYGGRVNCALRDYAQSRAYFQSYYRTTPDPVGIPTACYFDGVSALGLEDRNGALEAFRKGATLGLDTGYSGKCRAELNRLGDGVAVSPA